MTTERMKAAKDKEELEAQRLRECRRHRADSTQAPVKLTRTWQTVDYARYQVLQHSEEFLACPICGKRIQPE